MKKILLLCTVVISQNALAISADDPAGPGARDYSVLNQTSGTASQGQQSGTASVKFPKDSPYDVTYDCGMLFPGVDTRLFLAVSGKDLEDAIAGSSQEFMKPNFVYRGKPDDRGWHVAKKSSNSLSIEVGIGTGTTHVFSLQSFQGLVFLNITEVYYGVDDAKSTSLGMRQCSVVGSQAPSSNPAPKPVLKPEGRKFSASSLVSWTSFGDILSPKACNAAQIAQVQREAEQEALFDCKSGGFSNCRIEGSRILVSGRLSESVLSRYGKEDNFYFAHYGCEAEGLVFGSY